MDKSEELAAAYLAHLGFEDVVYEPDGNAAPDFLVNGRIAVEVRRLNQQHDDGSRRRGLEEVSIPLAQRIGRLLSSMGSPGFDGESWFVSFNFRRPVEPWKTLAPRIQRALNDFRSQPIRGRTSLRLENQFVLHLLPATKHREACFSLGGYSDNDAGGWVIEQIVANLNSCIEEKAAKVAEVAARYPEWWLVLPDLISYGSSDEADIARIRNQIRVQPPFSKVVLLDPANASGAWEI